MVRRGLRKRGATPLLAGLATSFLLICFGFAGALFYALNWGGHIVYLGFFTVLWAGLACLGGGFTAGARGGAGYWLQAGLIGFATGCFVLLFLRYLAPASVTALESCFLLGVPVLLGWLGALGGANRQARRSANRRLMQRGNLFQR